MPWICMECGEDYKENTELSLKYEFICPKCYPRKRSKNNKINKRACVKRDCIKEHGNYNWDDEKWGKYCYECKEPGMVDVLSTKCNEKGCNQTHPVWGFPDGKVEKCFKHRETGMINLREKRKCQKDGCRTRPCYGINGEKATHCEKHADKTIMNNVVSKLCNVEGCTKQPSYGYEVGKAVCCAPHGKELNMVDVKTRRCDVGGCETICCYGYPGHTPRKCVTHALIGMVDIRNYQCEFDGCTKQPNYGYEDERPSHCKKHKLNGMLYLNSHCVKIGCYNQKQYNLKDLPPKYCSLHATKNMVNTAKRTCLKEDCSKIALYGYLGDICIRCQDHQEENMLRYPKTICRHSGCSEYALYGSRINKQEYCEIHKLKSQYPLTKRKCKCLDEVLCEGIAVLSPDGLCSGCDPSFHFRRRMKADEEKIKQWLLESDQRDFIHDRRAPNIKYCFDKGYRPDFRFEDATHTTILECDENKHKYYESRCELARMVETAQANGGPTVFVRYNPDSFIKDGVEVQIPESIRKKILFEVLKWCRNNPPKNFLSVIYLFYDNFELKFKLEPIDIYEEAKK